jgi:hypothetical protein
VPLAAAVALAAPGSAAGKQERPVVQVSLGQRVIDRFHSNSITVSGLTARSIDVRLLGAIDMTGLAYKWTPYRWRPLRLRQGVWCGALPAPVLLGIYQLQLRLDHGRRLITSTHWLERVFPHGTEARHSFDTPNAVIHDYVSRLPSDEILVDARRWPLPAYDHRDPRLQRLFVIAYTPRVQNQRGSQVGKFITIVRDGFHGRWRLLQATTEPPD